jgi:glucosylceramidase
VSGEAGGEAGANGGASGETGTGGEAGASGGRGGGGASGEGGSVASGAAGGPAGASGTSGGDTSTGGTAGAGGSNTAGSAGSAGTGGSNTAGNAGNGGTAGTGGGTLVSLLVTSAPGAYWVTNGTLADSTANANVLVDDTVAAQTWEGFGGTFNELGWTHLTTQTMKDTAIRLLFSADDGCNFAWGRIPMGASDYASSRYTLDDTGSDVVPNSGESNRPPADLALSSFSLTRDGVALIPYIRAAQAVKPNLRFWASPWTPPVWMKTGYRTTNAGSGGSAVRPSYFDGGTMKNDSATLASYAQYFVKFVEGYRAQGINVEVVSPQNEPGYDQNYPSCLWDSATYTTFVGQHLGPAMASLGPPVKIMLGTLSNAGDLGRNDIDLANAVLMNATGRAYVSLAGVQWGVLDRVNGGTRFDDLPSWATSHKCGNYPWNPSGFPAYNPAQAPNDQAYAVESWGYIKRAIAQGDVTTYSAWNMVLDRVGLGIDTSRDWRQNALLVANQGTVTPTPTYYVFRHLSQYVAPGASVLETTGGDAVAFKNPDGSLVAVMFNSGQANPSYVVDLGGTKFSFAMPANGWATVKYAPE